MDSKPTDPQPIKKPRATRAKNATATPTSTPTVKKASKKVIESLNDDGAHVIDEVEVKMKVDKTKVTKPKVAKRPVEAYLTEMNIGAIKSTSSELPPPLPQTLAPAQAQVQLEAHEPNVESTYVKPATTSGIVTTKVPETASVTTTVKRGRKPKVVFNAFNAFDAQSNGQIEGKEENEDIIMKLKVNSSSHSSSIITSSSSNDANESTTIDKTVESFDQLKNAEYTSGIGAFNENAMDNFSVVDSTISTTNKVSSRIVNILQDFEEKTKCNEWPMSTSICCYWCCNPFQCTPIGLPCKIHNNKFHVCGCFCSIECAAAYNIHDLRDSLVEERMNLLNLLAREIDPKFDKAIKPAPPRLCLKMFGGTMAIDDFRRFSSRETSFSSNFPPMVMLVQQMEEINDSEIQSSRYVPLDNDRIDKYKEKIKLRRENPVNASKNTLENVMQFSLKL